METDKNPFPKIDLFPRLTKVAACIGRLASFLPNQAPDYMSDHYRGGAAMLDRELYDGVETHGFLYEGEQLELDYGREQ